MREQFVSYEIALKLKELGFNEPCLASYEEEFLNIDSSDINKNFEWSEYSDCCSVPLWQQVLDWFLDKKILIQIPAIDDWNRWAVTIYMEDISCPFYLASNLEYSEFDSYEEAREAAILKAIELCQK